MEIRAAESTDTDAINLLITQATGILRKTYSPANMTPVKERVTAEPRGQLVAHIDGSVVAVVEYIEKNDQIYIQGLAVEPARHRQGIARALITRLEQLCRERNFSNLALATIEETGNVHIFQQLRFAVVERQQTDLYNSERHPTLHLVKMVKPVSVMIK